jgi:hypothetical protein
LKHAASTCGGANSQTSTDLTATITGAGNTVSVETCKDACFALGDDCYEWYINDAGDACTAYSGFCDFAAGATNDKIYHKIPCCYWTSPTLVIADSLCANKAEATMNGANSANYEYTSAADNLAVAWNKMTCQ